MPEALSQALATPGLGWLLVAVCVAGLVRGFAGFGSAMIIMPVAGSLLSPVGALVFLTMTDLFGPLPNLPRALKDGNRADALRLGFGALLAMPLGIWAVSRLDAEIFRWMVSCLVLVLLGLVMAGWRYRGALTARLIVATGGLGGFLSGLTGLAGPPVIMLYMASALPPATIRANFLLYLFMIDLLMIATLLLFGLLESGPMLVGLLLAAPYMLSNAVGGWLFNPRAEPAFRAVAYTIIAVSAALGLPLWH
jgi:uncharacterized membrane protein YfcA